MVKLLLVLLPTLLLGAPNQTVRYNCAGGQTLEVSFRSNRAELSIPGKAKLKLLKTAANYSDGYSVLTVNGPDATFASGALNLMNCRDATAKAQPVSLLGKWELVTLDGQPVTLSRAPFIEFKSETGVAGFAGCNRFSTSYTAAAPALSFKDAVSTKMACPSEQMQAETRVFNALSKTASYQFADGTLTLLNAAGQPLATLRKL
jgi:heat shock protein HslJ